MVMGNKESISYNQTSEDSKLDACEYICKVSGLYDLFEKLAFDPCTPLPVERGRSDADGADGGVM